MARDERWESFEGEDIAGTMEFVSRATNPTVSTVSTPPLVTETVNATLELDLGVNVLRIDATDPTDLPLYDPDQGWQIFNLVIGPDDPELQGGLGVVDPPVEFRRGDPDDSGSANISDAVSALNHLFGGADRPPCWEAADVNGDGVVNIADPVGLLNYLFGSGDTPPDPGPDDCGPDPDPGGSVGCEAYTNC